MSAHNIIFFSLLLLLFIGCININDDDSQEPNCWTAPADLPELDGRTNWVAFYKNDTYWRSLRSTSNTLAENVLAGSTIDINYQDFGERDIISVFAEMKVQDTCQDIFSQFNFTFPDAEVGESNYIGGSTTYSDYAEGKTYVILYNEAMSVNLTKLNHEENRVEGTFSFDMINNEDDLDTLRVRQGRFQGDF